MGVRFLIYLFIVLMDLQVSQIEKKETFLSLLGYLSTFVKNPTCGSVSEPSVLLGLSGCHFSCQLQSVWASLRAQLVKNLPAVQETLIQFLGQEDPPEKGLATHASVLRLPFVAQLVKNLPAVWETWVRSLGWEDPLEKGKATHSSILAWRIRGRKEWDMTERLSLSQPT